MKEPDMVQFGRSVEALIKTGDPDHRVVAEWLFEFAIAQPFERRLEARLKGATVAEVSKMGIAGR